MSWRSVKQTYNRTRKEHPKKHMLPTQYVPPYAPLRSAPLGVLPFVESLVCEVADIRQAYVSTHPKLPEAAQADGKAHQMRSCLAIGSQEQENKLVNAFLDCARTHGLDETSTVTFDETWHPPYRAPKNLSRLQTEFETQTGATIRCHVDGAH